LPSNELFRLSGVMSQYIQDILPKMLHFLFWTVLVYENNTEEARTVFFQHLNPTWI
jgi:hypothetical protein